MKVFNSFYVKFLTVVISILCVLGLLKNLILMDYINIYNKNSPYFISFNYLSFIKEKKYQEALSLILNNNTGFNDYISFKDYVVKKYGEDIISFDIIFAQSNNDVVSFNLFVNGEFKDILSFKVTKNFDRYLIKKYDLILPSDLYSEKIIINVPSDSSVHVNGNFVDFKFIKNKNTDGYINDILYKTFGFLNRDIYEIDNIIALPNIVSKDKNGNSLKLYFDPYKKEYIANIYKNELKERYFDFLLNVTKAYLSFMIYNKDVLNLKNFVYKDSKFLNVLENANSDIDISKYNYSFDNFKVLDLVDFSNNYFSSNVEFNFSYSSVNETVKYNIIFLSSEDDKEQKLINIINAK